MDTDDNAHSLLALSAIKFKQKLKNGSLNIDVQDKDGKTLLLHSVEQQKTQHLEALLAAKANPWIKDSNGRDAFHMAAEKGSLAMFRRLAKYHGDTQEWFDMLQNHNVQLSSSSNQVSNPLAYLQNNNNYPCAFFLKNFHKYKKPLSRALMLGDIGAIDEQIKLDKEIIDRSLTGNDPKYRIAVENGAKKIKRDTYLTPLGFSILLQDAQLASHLLEHGARDSGTFITYSIAEELPLSFAELLDQYNVPFPTPLPKGIEHIRQALNQTISIDQRDSRGNTALHWACTVGNPDHIAKLIDKGANINVVDTKKHRSGLSWLERMHKGAVEKFGQQITTSRFLPCLFLMIGAGANSRIKDEKGKTIHDWLSEIDKGETEQRLINRVLSMKSLPKKKHKDFLKRLLEDIYDFQVKDMNQWRENDSKFDLADVYEIQKALVKEPAADGQLQFKAIYKKYIE